LLGRKRVIFHIARAGNGQPVWLWRQGGRLFSGAGGFDYAKNETVLENDVFETLEIGESHRADVFEIRSC
jgi:hypothetical protein